MTGILVSAAREINGFGGRCACAVRAGETGGGQAKLAGRAGRGRWRLDPRSDSTLCNRGDRRDPTNARSIPACSAV